MTRLEPNLAPNPRAINLEVLTFYADAPVVPGSIERAVERARAGQVAEGVQTGDVAQVWEAGPDVVDGPVGGTTLSSLAETSYREGPSTLFRRDTPTEESSTRPTYPYSARLSTDAYRPASSAGPGAYGANGAGETSDRPASAVSSRLPLRNDDEAVYRRMGDSERAEGWRRGRGGWSAYHGEGTMEAGGGSMGIPREGFYARPMEEYVRHGEAPMLPERAALLVEPLPPSRFTSQMHIPPFRG